MNPTRILCIGVAALAADDERYTVSLEDFVHRIAE